MDGQAGSLKWNYTDGAAGVEGNQEFCFGQERLKMQGLHGQREQSYGIHLCSRSSWGAGWLLLAVRPGQVILTLSGSVFPFVKYG